VCSIQINTVIIKSRKYNMLYSGFTEIYNMCRVIQEKSAELCEYISQVI
jgi:hypothetical protein